MQPLATRGLDEADHPDGGKPFSDFARGSDDLRPAHRLAEIEIHNDHVRLVRFGSEAPQE